MFIDIEEKFKRNIIDVYEINCYEKIKKTFPTKELGYWEFTLDLIRKEPNKTF